MGAGRGPNFFLKFRKQKGAALVEYVIILALGILVSLAVIGLVGQNLKNTYNCIGNALSSAHTCTGMSLSNPSGPPNATDTVSLGFPSDTPNTSGGGGSSATDTCAIPYDVSDGTSTFKVVGLDSNGDLASITSNSFNTGAGNGDYVFLVTDTSNPSTPGGEYALFDNSTPTPSGQSPTGELGSCALDPFTFTITNSQDPSGSNQGPITWAVTGAQSLAGQTISLYYGLNPAVNQEVIYEGGSSTCVINNSGSCTGSMSPGSQSACEQSAYSGDNLGPCYTNDASTSNLNDLPSPEMDNTCDIYSISLPASQLPEGLPPASFANPDDFSITEGPLASALPSWCINDNSYGATLSVTSQSQPNGTGIEQLTFNEDTGEYSTPANWSTGVTAVGPLSTSIGNGNGNLYWALTDPLFCTGSLSCGTIVTGYNWYIANATAVSGFNLGDAVPSSALLDELSETNSITGLLTANTPSAYLTTSGNWDNGAPIATGQYVAIEINRSNTLEAVSPPVTIGGGTGAGAWSNTSIDSTKLTSVSCPTTSFCAAADSNGNILTTADGGNAWTPVAADPSQYLYSVSCGSASFCAAGDANGGIVTTANGGSSWSAVNQIDTENNAAYSKYNPISAVSCSSNTFCVATDQGGYAFTYNGSSWSNDGRINKHSSASAPDPFEAVSCAPGTSTCIAVSSAGYAYKTSNGSAWAQASRPDANSAIMSISCPSTSVCMAVDYSGNVLISSNGGSSWSTGHISSTELVSISCASTSFCAAVDTQGNVFTTPNEGGSWSSEAIDPGSTPTSISCASTSFCILVDTSGNELLATQFSDDAYQYAVDAAPYSVGLGGNPTNPNWSGYELGDGGENSGPYTYISGNFNVPAISATSSNSSLTIWAGIDGVNTPNKLIQAGVGEEYNASTSQSTAWAWWEVLPANQTTISQVPVAPGDTMSVIINQVSPGLWAITVTNDTTRATYTTTQNYNGPGSAAEWILEAPDIGTTPPLSPYAPDAILAHYGEVTFNALEIGGTTSNLLNPASQLTMVQCADPPSLSVACGTKVSVPSTLTNAGFNVAYGDTAPSAP